MNFEMGSNTDKDIQELLLPIDAALLPQLLAIGFQTHENGLPAVPAAYRWRFAVTSFMF